MKKQIVVRYENRKLYSQNLSRYVTQNELMEYVKGGGDIVVTEYKTGKNITQNVMKNMLTKCNFDSTMIAELIRKSS